MNEQRLAVISELSVYPYDRATTNCWWLVCEIQRKLFGRDLPAASTRAIDHVGERKTEMFGHPVYQDWQERPDPIDGCIVLMAKPFHLHAGVYLSGFGIVHSDHPHGLVCDDLPRIQFARWRVTFMVPR